MPRHGMGTATPVHMEQTEDDRRHTEVHGGTESHLREQSLSHACTVTHSPDQTALHISACGVQAVSSQAVAALDVPDSRCAQGMHI